MNPRNPVILCVDDEEANLKLLENILVPRGYDGSQRRQRKRRLAEDQKSDNRPRTSGHYHAGDGRL